MTAKQSKAKQSKAKQSKAKESKAKQSRYSYGILCSWYLLAPDVTCPGVEFNKMQDPPSLSTDLNGVELPETCFLDDAPLASHSRFYGVYLEVQGTWGSLKGAT